MATDPKPLSRGEAEAGGAVKHTPWTYSPQAGHPGRCHMAQVWDARGFSLADIEPTDDPEDATANARLIAAAPELLAAAHRGRTLCVALIVAAEQAGTRLADRHTFRRGLAAFKAAIAKAEGQANG